MNDVSRSSISVSSHASAGGVVDLLCRDEEAWNRDNPSLETGSNEAVIIGGSAVEQLICPICLESPRSEDVATIDGCAHRFCFECINHWADIKDECPLCRMKFHTMYNRGTETKVRSNSIGSRMQHMGIRFLLEMEERMEIMDRIASEMEEQRQIITEIEAEQRALEANLWSLFQILRVLAVVQYKLL